VLRHRRSFRCESTVTQGKENATHWSEAFTGGALGSEDQGFVENAQQGNSESDTLPGPVDP
jgi:hypothetical protein